MQPLTLHAHATGPNPIKIALALEALHLPYTIQQWQFGDDPNNGVKGAAFLRINENGRVPALQDPNTGVVSWESGAIMNYVRRVYDKQNVLGPVGDKEQDKVDFEKWEYFLLSTLGPMTGQTNWFRYVNLPSILADGYMYISGRSLTKTDTTTPPRTKMPWNGTRHRHIAATRFSRASCKNPEDRVSYLVASRR